MFWTAATAASGPPPQRDGFTGRISPWRCTPCSRPPWPLARQQAPTAYFYAIGLTQAAERTPLLVEQDGGRQMHPALFALAYELHEQAQAVFGYESALFARREFDQYEEATVRSFLGEARATARAGWASWASAKPPITPQPETLRMALLLAIWPCAGATRCAPCTGACSNNWGGGDHRGGWRQLTAFDLEQTEPPRAPAAGRLRFARLTNLAVAFTPDPVRQPADDLRRQARERLRITQAFQAWFSASYAEPPSPPPEAVQDAVPALAGHRAGPALGQQRASAPAP